MLLTRRMLNQILRSWRIWNIPAGLKEELLKQYGNLWTDDEGFILGVAEGHLNGYTEQDICEQLRKIIRPYGNRRFPKSSLEPGLWTPFPVT